jgi:hypothetical protein
MAPAAAFLFWRLDDGRNRHHEEMWQTKLEILPEAQRRLG